MNTITGGGDTQANSCANPLHYKASVVDFATQFNGPAGLDASSSFLPGSAIQLVWTLVQPDLISAWCVARSHQLAGSY